MPVVSVSMPDALVAELDAFTKDHAYSGRSEVVREATRSLLTEFDDDRLAGRPLAGIVSVRYAFDTRSVERRLSELRREHDPAVVTTDHCHVDGDCLEVFVLESDRDVIAAFVARCRSIAAAETVDYSLVPLDGDRLPDA